LIDMVNAILLIAQGSVAVVFMLTGAKILFSSRELIAEKERWVLSWPRWRLKLLGLAEIAGGVGLVLPGATGIAPTLTPLAAFALAVLMVGGVRTNQRFGGNVVPAAVIGAVCLVIGVGRVFLAAG
jgi:hypothetical protein